MGTNYYTKKSAICNDDPQFHIGKRSAAGPYCWDCHATLCMGGEEAVHSDRDRWFEKCPVCGASKASEGLSESSAGRELGFNKSAPSAKSGVRSCSSFSWAMPEGEWRGRCRRVWDEYGRSFTKDEFEDILLECPIRYTRSIGVWFS